MGISAPTGRVGLRTFRKRLLLTAALPLLLAGPAAAADLSWDGATLGPPVDGGDGDWLAPGSWNNIDTGISASWTNNSFATFEGTPGTVTLNGNVSAQALTFRVGGYVISGTGRITLEMGEPVIIDALAGTSTINVNIATLSTLIRGPGELVLGNANTFGGTNYLRDGVTVTLNHATAFADDPLNGGGQSVNFGGNTTLRTLVNSTVTGGLEFNDDATVSAATGATLTLTGDVRVYGGVTATFGSTTDTGNIHASGFLDADFESHLVFAGGRIEDHSTGAFGGSMNALSVTVASGAVLDLTRHDYGQIRNLGGGGEIEIAAHVGGAGYDVNVIADGGTSQQFDGTITGNGTVRIATTNDSILPANGTIGTVVFTGAHTYTEGTLIETGRLLVEGSIIAPTQVNAGGILGGSGNVGAVVVGAGGTLQPGSNGIGILTASGNVTFAAGSTYAVEVSPTTADRTEVAGTANLSGGTVATTYQPGSYVAREYVILSTTGGLGGTSFAGITGTAPSGLAQSLRYDANNAYLVLDIYTQATAPDLNDNQRAVADALNRYFNANGGIPGAYVGLSAGQLTVVGGQTAAGAVSSGITAQNEFLAQLSDPFISGRDPAGGSAPAPLAYADDMAMSSMASAIDTAFASRWKMWGAAYGGAQNVRGDAAVVGSANLAARGYGIATGFDRSFGDGRVGFGLGGAGSSFSLADGPGSGTAGIFNAGIYGSHTFGNAYVSGAFAYAWNNVKTTRFAAGDTLTANFNAQTLSGRIEAGYRWGATSAITPYVALQGSSYMLPAYVERSALGGPFALAYARQAEGALRSEFGARFEHAMPIATGSLKFSGRAAWAYNAVNDRAVTAAFAALPGQTFTINGAKPARHAALVDLGVEAAFDGGVSAKLNFNGEFSRNVSAYGASAKLTYRW